MGVKWHNEGMGQLRIGPYRGQDHILAALSARGPCQQRVHGKGSAPVSHVCFFCFPQCEDSSDGFLHQAPACPNWKPSPPAELPALFNHSLPRSCCSLQDSSRARRALPICRITFPVLSLQASFKNPPSCYLCIHIFPGKTFNVE